MLESVEKAERILLKVKQRVKQYVSIRNSRQKSIYVKSCVKQFLKFPLLLSVLRFVCPALGQNRKLFVFFSTFDYPEAGEKWIFKSLKYIGDKMSLVSTI